MFAKSTGHIQICDHCHSTEILRHGNSQLRLTDLPYQNKKVMIFITRKRFKCTSCGKTFQESIPHQNGNSRMTNGLVRFIKDKYHSCSKSKLSQFLHVDRSSLDKAFNEYKVLYNDLLL